MVKKRRLTDLYKVGKLVLMNDDSDEKPVEVYIRKLNPVEAETAVRNANVKRSQIIRDGKNPESDVYQDAMADVLDMEKEHIVERLMSEDVAKIRASVEAEFSEEDEWAENDYLQGLRDGWENELAERYSADPTDSEALGTFNELKRFYEQVAAEVDIRSETVREGWMAKDLDELVELCIQHVVDNNSSAEWLKEFRLTQVYLACKNPEDKKSLYFSSREEMNDLESEVVQRLVSEYMSLEVDATEGKSSEETPDSSNS